LIGDSVPASEEALRRCCWSGRDSRFRAFLPKDQIRHRLFYTVLGKGSGLVPKVDPSVRQVHPFVVEEI
jgi:hypothetical protein